LKSFGQECTTQRRATSPCAASFSRLQRGYNHQGQGGAQKVETPETDRIIMDELVYGVFKPEVSPRTEPADSPEMIAG